MSVCIRFGENPFGFRYSSYIIIRFRLQSSTAFTFFMKSDVQHFPASINSYMYPNGSNLDTLIFGILQHKNHFFVPIFTKFGIPCFLLSANIWCLHIFPIYIYIRYWPITAITEILAHFDIWVFNTQIRCCRVSCSRTLPIFVFFSLILLNLNQINMEISNQQTSGCFSLRRNRITLLELLFGNSKTFYQQLYVKMLHLKSVIVG